jgi:hypothetical protein
VCPAKHELHYKTTNRSGYREYKSKPKVCQTCPFLSKCTHSKTFTKTITRHVWEDAKEWVRHNRLSDRGKQLYKRRSETIERSFADAKELHGLRYARYRGIAKVREQCLLTAVAQNVKKMALLLSKRGKSFVLWLLQHMKFPLSVHSPEIYNPWPFFTKEPGVCHQAQPFQRNGFFLFILSYLINLMACGGTLKDIQNSSFYLHPN